MYYAIATTKLDIVTVTQAVDYLRALHNAGLMYHLEDDPKDCLWRHELTEEQLENIRANSRQAVAVDWPGAGYDDVFDYKLTNDL